MISLVLPWPCKELNPNSRNKWGKIKAVTAYREHAKSISQIEHDLPSEGPLAVSIMFYAPSNRGDLDNMLAMVKSGLDGIAKGLGINDKRFKPITIDSVACKASPRVEVTIEKI